MGVNSLPKTVTDSVAAVIWTWAFCAWVQHANHSATEALVTQWYTDLHFTIRQQQQLKTKRREYKKQATKSNYCETLYGYFPQTVNNTHMHACTHAYTHTHTHPFNGPLSGTTQVSRYQKGKTNLDFTGARDSEWQWHQLCHMQVCTSLQTDNHASTPPLSFFTGRMPFLPPNQQRQSTEGKTWINNSIIKTDSSASEWILSSGGKLHSQNLLAFSLPMTVISWK